MARYVTIRIERNKAGSLGLLICKACGHPPIAHVAGKYICTRIGCYCRDYCEEAVDCKIVKRKDARK